MIVSAPLARPSILISIFRNIWTTSTNTGIGIMEPAD